MARPKQNEKNDEFWVLLSISVMVIVQDGRVYFLGQECLKDRRLKSHSSADVSRRSTYLFGQNAYERFRPDRFFHNSTQSLPTASRFTFPHPTQSPLKLFFLIFHQCDVTQRSSLREAALDNTPAVAKVTSTQVSFLSRGGTKHNRMTGIFLLY